MPPVSFDSLAVVLAVAFVVPLDARARPELRIPSVVVEIVAGIIVGPQVLGWADIDEPVRILSIVGLAVLLFLAGLEIDTSKLRGRLLRVAGLGFAGSVRARAGGRRRARRRSASCTTRCSPPSSCSRPRSGSSSRCCKESGATESTLGQLVILGSSIGDFAAVILLSLLFSTDTADTGTTGDPARRVRARRRASSRWR